MEFGDREEIRLLMAGGLDCSDDSSSSSSPLSSSSMCLCRICHEEEEESSTSMETPCACSGTLKFAHRECIQRWCDEKGNTVCEICLQKFEPGYTVAPKLALVDVPVTIRGSLEVPRLNYESQNQMQATTEAAADEESEDYAACTAASERGASCCRSLALAFTIIMLVRHFLIVLSAGADHYALALAIVFVLRAGGILLPCYLLLRVITAIQNRQRRYRLQGRDVSPADGVSEDEDSGLQHHAIQIHS